MEAQLADAQGQAIRSRANDVYERVVNAIFSSVQQLAKMDRGDALAAEDKGQINYHVIMIGEPDDLYTTLKLNSSRKLASLRR